MEEYERSAGDLLEWIAKTTPWLEDRTTDNKLAGAQRRLEEFRQYRQLKKPPRVEQKALLETNFNTLQTKLRLNNRPAYMPTQGKEIVAIVNAWKVLQEAERGFEEWLLSEMMRLERLEHLAKKFNHKCDIHETWTTGKEAMLQSQDYRNSRLNDVKALKKKHEAFESDLTAHQDRVDQIVYIADELNKLGYCDSSVTEARRQNICSQWTLLKTLSQKRRQDLESAEQLLETIDRYHLEFAKRAAPFNNWLDSSREDLVDVIFVHTIDEIKNLISAHEKFKLTLGEADREYESIIELANRVTTIVGQNEIPGGLENPFTALTADEITSKWNDLRRLIPERDLVLNNEFQRQERNEALRRKFAEQANVVGPWLENRIDDVANIGMGVFGSLEDQLEKLKQHETTVHQYRPHIDELERVNQDLQREMILDNRYTQYTMETLRVGWEQLLTSIHRNINEVENQILTRDSRGLTQEQLNDFRASFNHFDRQRVGYITPDEFRSCLVSVGYNIRNDRQGDSDFRRIMALVDPNDTKMITFDAFLDFMSRENTDRDTADQIVDSFRILAGDRPYIRLEELRQELPSDMAEYCAKRMQRFASGVEDALDYESFTHTLYMSSSNNK
jgi:actinin alpha